MLETDGLFEPIYQSFGKVAIRGFKMVNLKPPQKNVGASKEMFIICILVD